MLPLQEDRAYEERLPKQTSRPVKLVGPARKIPTANRFLPLQGHQPEPPEIDSSPPSHHLHVAITSPSISSVSFVLFIRARPPPSGLAPWT